MKIKDGKNTFEVELKSLNLQERCELNDKLLDQETKRNFSYWVWVVQFGTTLTDEDINKYSTSQIVEISNVIFEEVNKKK
jgi:hypothetical protein